MRLKVETGRGINKKLFYRGLWRQEKMDLRTCRRRNKSSWKIPRIPALIKSFAFSGFSYLQVTEERWPFFLTDCQKVNRSLLLCHNAYVTHITSSRGHFIISHRHKKKGEDSTMKCFERESERTHSYNFCSSILW